MISHGIGLLLGEVGVDMTFYMSFFITFKSK